MADCLNSRENFTSLAIQFFNQKNGFEVETKGKNINKNTKRKFLLLLENVEDLI